MAKQVSEIELEQQFLFFVSMRLSTSLLKLTTDDKLKKAHSAFHGVGRQNMIGGNIAFDMVDTSRVENTFFSQSKD